jgi:hypothetical protein
MENNLPTKHAVFRRQFKGEQVIGEYRISVYPSSALATERVKAENRRASGAESFYSRQMTDAEVLAYLPAHIRNKYQGAQ